MGIIIRDMNLADLDDVMTLAHASPELASSEHMPFWERERLETWLVEGDDIMLVAEDEDSGIVVGFLITEVHQASRKAYFSECTVARSFQRHGVAGMFLQEAVKRFRERGITYVWALTHVGNRAMRIFFDRHGFRIGEHMIWYELPLGGR